MNNKLLKTILFSVGEKLNTLKNNLGSDDNLNEIVNDWADNEFLPTLKDFFLTSFQIKDRLNTKNSILVSVPKQEKLHPNEILECLNDIIDPNDNFPGTDLIIGFQKIPDLKPNADPSSNSNLNSNPNTNPNSNTKSSSNNTKLQKVKQVTSNILNTNINKTRSASKKNLDKSNSSSGSNSKEYSYDTSSGIKKDESPLSTNLNSNRLSNSLEHFRVFLAPKQIVEIKSNSVHRTLFNNQGKTDLSKKNLKLENQI